MFERDYLMRLIMDLVVGIRRAMDRASAEEDPLGAAHLLDMTIGQATDIDPATLLVLSPESIASVLDISGVDPALAGYIARSFLLAAAYYDAAGERSFSDLRRAQGLAVARAYGIDLPDGADFELEMKEFLAR